LTPSAVKTGLESAPVVFASKIGPPEAMGVLWDDLIQRRENHTIKKSQHTAEQVTFAVRQAKNGTSVPEVWRKMSVSEQSFYRWKKRSSAWM
jgi:hypothetical protein